jgi:hypothetical protein
VKKQERTKRGPNKGKYKEGNKYKKGKKKEEGTKRRKWKDKKE